MIFDAAYPSVTSREWIRWMYEVGHMPWCAIQGFVEWGREKSWPEIQSLFAGTECGDAALLNAWEARGWSEARRKNTVAWLQAMVPEWSVQQLADWISAQPKAWRWYVPTDPEYPSGWLSLEDPPPVFWASQDLGDWQTDDQRRWLAVVGSRRQSSYGRLVAQDFVRSSVESYRSGIVSGAAYGVDMTAHLTCLHNGGKTIAVLPQGCARIPSRLDALLVEPNCLAVTEFPPETPVQRWHYAQRNRLISGWAEAVLVVEATKQSGTFLTAAAAFSQGKEVYVVTQPRQNPQAEGVCQLVENGAHLVCDPHQMWTQIASSAVSQRSLFSEEPTKEAPKARNFRLLTLVARASTELEKAIIRFLWDRSGQCFAGECRTALAEKVAVSSEWARAIYTLEIKGIVRQELGLLHLQSDV